MPIQEAKAAPTELRPAVALFRSLADPTRLAIIQHLVGGSSRVTDLVDAMGLPQSTVSTHLACLRDCELVTGRPEGRQVFYALAHPELLDLLQAAEQVLARTGAAVALRGRHLLRAGHLPPLAWTLTTSTPREAGSGLRRWRRSRRITGSRLMLYGACGQFWGDSRTLACKRLPSWSLNVAVHTPNGAA